MSRISRARVEAGDAVTAADLNARYSDFSQAGAVNAYNTRDAAFDLNHFPTTSGLILKNSTDGDVGTGDIYHSAPNTVASTAVGPATPTLITGAVGNVVSTAASGWTTVAGDIPRVYFNLQARPQYVGTPMYTAGPPAAMGRLSIDNGLGGSNVMADGNHVWLVQLEWDITSNVLANFVPIPGQQQGTSLWSGTPRYGMGLDKLAGTAVVPAWHTACTEWVDGNLPNTATTFERELRWFGASGSWVYTSTGQTVYGFRLRAHGIYHPAQDASGNNGLVLDTVVAGATQILSYDGGHIVAMHMKVA
jgi:hypothetical protein